MLEETYKRRGITPRTDFTKLTSEDYPILSDLYRVIEEKLESYDEEAALSAKAGHPVMYSLEMLKSVGLGLRGICIGAMSRYLTGTPTYRIQTLSISASKMHSPQTTI